MSAIDNLGKSVGIEYQGDLAQTARRKISRVVDDATLKLRQAFVNSETRINFDGANIQTDDWRVKVSVGANSGLLYQNPGGVLDPLTKTHGVIFPYTPSITTSFSAGYSAQKLTHSNYASHFYDSSEVAGISITGDFTVQSVEDGQYLLACIYFFRAATKMFYGASTHMGNPPPLLFLDGYGKYYLPRVLHFRIPWVPMLTMFKFPVLVVAVAVAMGQLLPPLVVSPGCLHQARYRSRCNQSIVAKQSAHLILKTLPRAKCWIKDLSNVCLFENKSILCYAAVWSFP